MYEPRQVQGFLPYTCPRVSGVVFFFSVEVRVTPGHSRWLAFELRFYFHNRNEFTEGLRGVWSGGSTEFVCTLDPFKFSQGCRGIGRQFDTDGSRVFCSSARLVAEFETLGEPALGLCACVCGGEE